MTIEVSAQTDYSDELRALALRFFSIDEAHRVERTENFMQLSSSLKDMRDYVDQLLKIMQSNKPFSKIKCEDYKFGIDGSGYSSYTTPLLNAQKFINQYSMEEMFDVVFKEAKRVADWGAKNSRRQLPHAEALAWLTYFSSWDQDEERLVMNDNWISYYKESYPGIKSK